MDDDSIAFCNIRITVSREKIMPYAYGGYTHVPRKIEKFVSIDLPYLDGDEGIMRRRKESSLAIQLKLQYIE